MDQELVSSSDRQPVSSIARELFRSSARFFTYARKMGTSYGYYGYWDDSFGPRSIRHSRSM
jgi:hypothetical protein